MKNLKDMLIEKGYKEGNNCYYKNINDDTIYFNMDDEENFTTVTYEPKGFGGQELMICDRANTEILEELEETNYKIEEEY